MKVSKSVRVYMRLLTVHSHVQVQCDSKVLIQLTISKSVVHIRTMSSVRQVSTMSSSHGTLITFLTHSSSLERTYGRYSLHGVLLWLLAKLTHGKLGMGSWAIQFDEVIIRSP